MVSPTAVFAVGCITTVVGGIGLSVQTGVNTTLGSHVGRGVASIVSFIGGLLLLTLFYLLDTYAAQAAIAPTSAQFKGAADASASRHAQQRGLILGKVPGPSSHTR
jgi:hypothetical protein